jgi:hypothetical protein
MGASKTQHLGFQNVLLPKPGVKNWMLIIDLRPVIKYCKEHKHLKTLTRAGD